MGKNVCFHIKMCFHFQNVLPFSECAFIFEMYFHFRDMLSFLKCVLNEHNITFFFKNKTSPLPISLQFLPQFIILHNTQKTAEHLFTLHSHFIKYNTVQRLMTKSKRKIGKWMHLDVKLWSWSDCNACRCISLQTTTNLSKCLSLW